MYKIAFTFKLAGMLVQILKQFFKLIWKNMLVFFSSSNSSKGLILRLYYLSCFIILNYYIFLDFTSVIIYNFIILTGAPFFIIYINFTGLVLIFTLFTLLSLISCYFLYFKSFLKNYNLMQYTYEEVLVFHYTPITNSFNSEFSLIIDHINLSFILLTLIILFLAIIFTWSYMSKEVFRSYFLYLLYFFGWSMILFLSANSFPTLLLGWELIGISSYLLINFWTTRISTFKSAFKAMIFNKLSDACLISAFIIYICTGPDNGVRFLNNIFLINHDLLVFGHRLPLEALFVLFITVAAFIKSA